MPAASVLPAAGQCPSRETWGSSTLITTVRFGSVRFGLAVLSFAEMGILRGSQQQLLFSVELDKARTLV